MQLHTRNMSHPGIPDFLKRFRSVLNEYGERFTVAEVVGPSAIEEMKSFTQGADLLSSAYNFDFLYARRLTPQRVEASMNQWTQETGEGWPSWAFSNHDAPRAVSRWAPPEHRDAMARLNLMLILSLRGNPILYQGEELGLNQGDVPFERLRDPEAIANWPKTLGRDGARTPFPWTAEEPHAGFSSGEPWLPVDADHPALSVSEQEQPGSCLDFCRTALDIRRQHACLQTGHMITRALSEQLLTIERMDADERILCLFNLSSMQADWPESVPSDAQRLLSSLPHYAFGDGPSLPPYAALWLRI